MRNPLFEKQAEQTDQVEMEFASHKGIR